MKFSARRCMPSRQGIKARLDAASTYHGVSLRLLLVDKQVDAEDVLPNAALASVHVVKYDAKATTLAELVGLVREAHRQNTAPFLSMAVAQHGADERGQWAWTSDLTVDLTNMHGAIDQLAPVIEVLAAALSKTKAGKAHIDLLACNLATTCKGLIPALEKMYGIDFRASTDETGNNLSGGDWKMETDNDYDVAADYLDAAKLREYTETMGGNQSCCGGRTGKPTGQKQKTPPQRPSTSSFDSIHLAARFDNPTQTSSSVSRYTLADGGTFAACVGAEIGARYQKKRGPIRAAAHGRASVEASVSAKFKNSKESIAAEVSLGIKAVAEAEATASAGGVVAVKAQAQAQLEAFAKAAATATLTNIAASCSAGFTASVSGKCEIELGPFTFRFAATASVGLAASAAFKAGWDKETGCFGFEAEVAATVGAGAGISATVQFNPEFFLQWLEELIDILEKLAKHARDCQRDCQRSCGSMMAL